MQAQSLIELLKKIESAIPPPEKCHHALTFAQYGSDEAGWEDKLCLQVNIGGKFQQFFLDDEDLANPNLPQEIGECVEHPSEETQFGVSMGQFLP